MKKVIQIATAHIHTTDDLFDIFSKRFAHDGIDYFAHNLDSLEEIVDEYEYQIQIYDIPQFLSVLGPTETHRYYGDRYEDDGLTIAELVLDIFDFHLPDGLSMHHEIGDFSGYKTRVFGSFYAEITDIGDIEKLHDIYHFAHEYGLPILVIGGGTNLLFAQDYYSAVVIKNSLSGWHYDAETQRLHTSSNEWIWQIAESLEKDHDQPIWHRFIGLPGSIGGAIVGNAGCFGLEAEHNFVQATIYDMEKGTENTLSKDDMQFGYRHSVLKEHPEYFLVSADFDLSEARERYHSDIDNIDFRENKQPKGNSCGSFFKNPSREVSAGMLIEQVGLKGHRHGGARWSELHANFLLSDGDTCKPTDLIELVRLTQAKVKKETGHELINEVKIIE